MSELPGWVEASRKNVRPEGPCEMSHMSTSDSHELFPKHDHHLPFAQGFVCSPAVFKRKISLLDGFFPGGFGKWRTSSYVILFDLRIFASVVSGDLIPINHFGTG